MPRPVMRTISISPRGRWPGAIDPALVARLRTRAASPGLRPPTRILRGAGDGVNEGRPGSSQWCGPPCPRNGPPPRGRRPVPLELRAGSVLDHGVVAGAAVEQVGAAAADEDVVAGLAV